MRPWQAKALQKGRKPLPDAPGVRPWIDESNQTSTAPDAAPDADPASATATDAAPAVAAPPAETADATAAPEGSSATEGTTGGTSQSYVFWRGDDLRRLVRMRNGGAKWSTIADAFPDRTLEALKQTYHKRRHATERLMAEEDAEAAAEAAGPSDGQ